MSSAKPWRGERLRPGGAQEAGWGAQREVELLGGQYAEGSGDALETCCVCLEALSSEAVTPLLLTEGRALQPACCRHYCHLRCAQRLRPQRCPVCRVHFKQLRRVTREGLLSMTAAELLSALQRLHGADTTTAAVDLIAAVFPIPLSAVAARFERLADGGLEAGGGDRLSELGLARVLAHLSKHSADVATPRPLSFYTGRDCGQPQAFAGGRRLRHGLLRLCSGLGGACHGLAVGCIAGIIGGWALHIPPQNFEGRAGDRKLKPETPRIHWVSLLDRLLDTLAPWHVFGSAFLAVILAIIVGCLSVLLVRLLLAAGRAAALLGRMAHRGLWVSMVTSVGAAASNEEIGYRLWSCSIIACTAAGGLCGLAHAAVVVRPARCQLADAFWRAAAGCFWQGARAGCRIWVSRRRRQENERLGDGSLCCMR